MFVSPERVSLQQSSYVIDSRPIVVPATKGRVMRHRPRLDSWKLKFQIEFDDTLVTEKQVRQIVDDSGRLVGLLDFRPEKRGPYGRFVVTHWRKD